jgi:hypothetical protein
MTDRKQKLIDGDYDSEQFDSDSVKWDVWQKTLKTKAALPNVCIGYAAPNEGKADDRPK